MKHLLNNLSEEEKNSIRVQHTGGMLVNNSRFNSLLENKLGNSKPLVGQFDDEDDSRIKNKLKHPGSEIMMVGHDYTLIKVEGTGEEQRKAVEWFGGYYKWTEGESHWEESIPNEKFGLRLLVNGPIFFIFPNDDNGDVGLVTGLPSERYLIQFEHRRFVDRLDKKFDVVRRFNGDFAEFKDILKEYLYPSEPTLDNELDDEELDEDTSWMNDLNGYDDEYLNEQSTEDVNKGKKTGCYTVKHGDTVLAIAKKFGITLDDIKALNGMTSGNTISPGQKLRVKNTTKFVGC